MRKLVFFFFDKLSFNTYEMQSLSRKNFWIIAVNSLASYVLAYLFIFYVNQLSYVLTAGMFNYQITVDYATYFFHVEPYQWTHDAVFVIFSSGYILTLIFGILSLLAFFSLSGSSVPVKVFFFWMVMHSSNYVFGGLLLGNLLTEGIGHVFNWMYLVDTSRLIISLVGFFGLVMTSLFAVRIVAISADSYFSKFNERMGPFFITAQVLVPFVLGAIIMFFYFYPKNMFHERFGWIVLAVMVFIFFMSTRFIDALHFEEDENRTIRPMKGLIVFTLIFLVVSRVALQYGISFSW